MHNRKPPSDSLLARAVEARAAGASWEKVGQLVGRSVHTVAKWPRTYPERWQAALRAAGRSLIDHTAALSVMVLRNLLASKNEKVRAMAAWRLIYQRLEQWKIDQKAGLTNDSDPPSDAHRIADFVKRHTHEELTELLAHMRTTRLPGRDGTRALPAPRAG